MISESQKRAFSPWLPAVFCAFLSLITLSNCSNMGPWAPAFFCFLPLCFFFVGAAIWQMRREILELRKQLSQLQRNDDCESR